MRSAAPPEIPAPAPSPHTAGAGGEVAVVYTTWPDLASAELAAATLLDARLAACLNILPGMISLYRWDGKIERATEVVMLIKTSATLAEACIEAVCRSHPYANPAALVIPIAGGAHPFLDWIITGTSGARLDDGAR
jgi:periplasmic divalent cation tolerance protein